MKKIVLGLLILSLPALARSDEDKLYEMLAPSVRSVSKPFTVFHWEKVTNEFSGKFKADTPAGLIAMTQASARSFIEQDAKFGFYVATDPVISRAFGKDEWRLVQLEVPQGWKYIDLASDLNLKARLTESQKDEVPCLRNMLTTYNSPGLVKGNGGEASGKCTVLKQKIFRRLGISGVRYSWLPTGLERYCKGRDKSAFIVTDGAWLNKENIKSYTADSTHSVQDRKAIQELMLNIPPPKMYKNTKPAPLWKDLPQQGSISEESKQWMNERLLNCREMKRALETEEEDATGTGESAE